MTIYQMMMMWIYQRRYHLQYC